MNGGDTITQAIVAAVQAAEPLHRQIFAAGSENVVSAEHVASMEQYHAVALHVVDKILADSSTRLNEAELQSFNQFLTVGLSNILQSCRIRKHRHKEKLYVIVFRKHSIGKPQIEEVDGSVHKQFISDTRYRDASSMCTINEWIDLYVWSTSNPLDQEEAKAGGLQAESELLGLTLGSGMDHLQSRTASKAKRVRVDLKQDVKIHRLIKKNKRRFEQEQQLQHQQQGSGADGEGAPKRARVGDASTAEAIDADMLDESPIVRHINGKRMYDWTRDPTYQQKFQEAKSLCCLTPIELQTYKYLVHFEHTTNHRLWEMPISDESIACHTSDFTSRAQDTLPNKGGNFIIGGKIKTMMRTPRLKYDYPFLFLDPKTDFFVTVRSSHPYNKYRSTGTLSTRVQKRGRYTFEHVVWDVPYAEDKFNIAFVALFRALGWLDNAAIKAAILFQVAHYFTELRAIPWQKLEKYIDDSLMFEASKVRTQEEAWCYIGERLKSDDTHKYNAYQNNLAAAALVAANNKRASEEAAALEAVALEAVATGAAAVVVEAPIEAPVTVPAPVTSPPQAPGRKNTQHSRKRTAVDALGPDATATTTPVAPVQPKTEVEKHREALQFVERRRAGESCICKEVLPHLGYAHDVFPEKAMYLAYMTAKLLLFKVGIIKQPDERDNVKNKRYMHCGEWISSFLRKKLMWHIKLANTSFMNALNHGQPINISTLFDHASLSKGIHTTFATGKIEANIPPGLASAAPRPDAGGGAPNAAAASNAGNKNAKDKTGVCQNQNSTNVSSLFSQQQRIAGNLQTGGGQVKARQICGDWGVVDFVETPEGAGCGIIKPHTLFAKCSIHTAPTNSLTSLLFSQNPIVPMRDIAATIVERWNVYLEECKAHAESSTLDVAQQPPMPNRDVMVMSNGQPLGMLARNRVQGLVDELRKVRYPFFGDTYLSIVRPNELNQASVLSDAGRLLVPLFCASKFDQLFPFLAKNLSKEALKVVVDVMKDKRETKAQRDMKQTQALIEHLPWDMLLKEGFIEYIDNEERDSCLVAFDPADYYRRRAAPFHLAFTHLEILPTLILGVCSSQIPFCEHNQAPRNTYQSNMSKQAIGQSATDVSTQLDTNLHVLLHPSLPLVSTSTLHWLRAEQYSSGVNIRSLLACYEGFNQEDATVICRRGLDLGMFRSQQICTITLQEKKKGSMNTIERFGKPSRFTTLGMKPGSYDALDEDGFLFPGTPVNNGDVLIGRMLPNNKTSPTADVHITKLDEDTELDVNGERIDYDKMAFMCTSIMASQKTSGVVLDTIVTSDIHGMKKVKTRVIKTCPLIDGDKVSSRHGQKGVQGKSFLAKDAPFTSDGEIPDLILDPQSVPSRMTIGHLLEMFYGQALLLNKMRGDTTAFTHSYAASLKLAEVYADELASTGAALGNADLSKMDVNDRMETISRTLKSKGHNLWGNQRMYNGKTGKLMGGDARKGQGMMFQGFIHYQKLVHRAEDKLHARARGPRHVMTRQPVEGGRHHGGYRLGEMERLAIMAHGCALFLRERHVELSDACDLTACVTCGYPAQAFIADGTLWCPFCKSSKGVRKVASCWSWVLFYKTLMSTAFFPRYILKTQRDPAAAIAESNAALGPYQDADAMQQ